MEFVLKNLKTFLGLIVAGIATFLINSKIVNANSLNERKRGFKVVTIVLLLGWVIVSFADLIYNKVFNK